RTATHTGRPCDTHLTALLRIRPSPVFISRMPCRTLPVASEVMDWPVWLRSLEHSRRGTLPHHLRPADPAVMPEPYSMLASLLACRQKLAAPPLARCLLS